MHHTTQRPDPPPGMPGDDGTEDGGGPPRRTPLVAIDKIVALSEARIAAGNWVRVSGQPISVVENGGRFFIADDADLATYHQADIDAGRAVVRWVAHPPAPLVVPPPDVAFVAWVGWDA